MIYFPETIIQWSTMLWRIFTLLLIDARWHLLCAWSSLEAVMGLSSLLPDILLCLLTSPVRTQLMLTGPHWGPQPPRPQSGVPSHGVRAHSLSRVQNSRCFCKLLKIYIFVLHTQELWSRSINARVSNLLPFEKPNNFWKMRIFKCCDEYEANFCTRIYL